jgi:hypothetical protein
MKYAYWAIVAAIIGMAAALAYHSLAVPPKVAEELPQTDGLVSDMNVGTETAKEESRLIEQTVRREVTVIRETVKQEVADLPPDALVNGVLFELELFRRASPDSP